MIGEGGDRVRNWQNVADEANKERERLATGLKEERLENDKLRQKLEFNSRESNAVGQEVLTIRKFYEEKITEMQNVNNSKLQAVKEDLRSMKDEKKIVKDRMNDQLMEHENFEDTLRNELERTINYYEGHVNGLKRDNQTLVNRFTALQETITIK